jgi:hypothetical protein
VTRRKKHGDELKDVVRAVVLNEPTTTRDGINRYRQLQRRWERIGNEEMLSLDEMWGLVKQSPSWKRIMEALDAEI